jgi:iduronate 2-sulfatase
MNYTTRRKFIQSGLTAAVGSKLYGQKVARSSVRKKNVLFIGVDDLATQIGCYGRPAHSPNLDRLAAQGVRFDAAHCQFPWCSPSRSSLMTGLSPDATRVYDLTTHFREALPNVVTLGELFRQNGYYSARVGKIFHASDPDEEGTDGLDDPMTWDWTFNPAGVDHYQEEKLLTNFTPKRGLGSAIAFHRSKAKESEITDAIGATEVIRLLRQPRTQPFFIAYGLYRPHVPWVVPESYFDRYPLEQMSPYPLSESELKMAPSCAYWTRPPNFGMDAAQQKQALQGYYAATTFMDAQVGRVLHELEASGHAENTLIVFWSDHGWQLGQHGQWMKQTLFEDATRVPLIFAGAGVTSHGKVCQRTVEHLDVYPTIADICELSNVPSTLHGASLRPLLRDPSAEWSKPAISQVRREATKDRSVIDGYSIRDERFRYTMWNEGREGEELYDYKTDPMGMKNIVEDPAMEQTKFRLHTALNATTLSRGRVKLPRKA